MNALTSVPELPLKFHWQSLPHQSFNLALFLFHQVALVVPVICVTPENCLVWKFRQILKNTRASRIHWTAECLAPYQVYHPLDGASDRLTSSEMFCDYIVESFLCLACSQWRVAFLGTYCDYHKYAFVAPLRWVELYLPLDRPPSHRARRFFYFFRPSLLIALPGPWADSNMPRNALWWVRACALETALICLLVVTTWRLFAFLLPVVVTCGLALRMVKNFNLLKTLKILTPTIICSNSFAILGNATLMPKPEASSVERCAHLFYARVGSAPVGVWRWICPWLTPSIVN